MKRIKKSISLLLALTIVLTCAVAGFANQNEECCIGLYKDFNGDYYIKEWYNVPFTGYSIESIAISQINAEGGKTIIAEFTEGDDLYNGEPNKVDKDLFEPGGEYVIEFYSYGYAATESDAPGAVTYSFTYEDMIEQNPEFINWKVYCYEGETYDIYENVFIPLGYENELEFSLSYLQYYDSDIYYNPHEYTEVAKINGSVITALDDGYLCVEMSGTDKDGYYFDKWFNLYVQQPQAEDFSELMDQTKEILREGAINWIHFFINIFTSFFGAFI